MADLEVRNQTLGGCLIVRVAGELDQAGAPVLRDHVLGHLALGHTNIVVDLTRVSFVDSAGVGVLLVAHHEATADGGRTRFAGVQDSVRQVLELTQVDRVLELHDDVSDALEAAMGSESSLADGPAEPTTTAPRGLSIAAAQSFEGCDAIGPGARTARCPRGR